MDVSVNSRASQTSVNDVKTVADTVNTAVSTMNTNVSSIGTKIDTANTNINTTNTRIGTSSDTSNSSGTTLFSLIKYVVGMFTGTWTATKAGYLDASISTVNANVDTSNTRIGTSSDTANSSGTTLFSLVRYIVSMFTGTWTTAKAAYLDATISSRASQDSVNTIGTTVNTIKTTVDGVKSTADTLNTNVNTANSSLSTINTNVNSANSTLGAINTTVSSRAAQTTADAIKAKTDLIGTSSAIGSVIKSIQSGYATLTNTTNNITISAVNVGKSFIIGSTTNIQLQLTSSTTLAGAGGVSATATVAWQVIEFY